MKHFENAVAPMGVSWVIGNFEGDMAKSVVAHTNAGAGYIVIDKPTRGNVIAAFRMANDSPIPDHLQEVLDPTKIAKFEKIRQRRLNNN